MKNMDRITNFIPFQNNDERNHKKCHKTHCEAHRTKYKQHQHRQHHLDLIGHGDAIKSAVTMQ